MVIKFDKKRRRLFVIIIALLIIIGGSVRTFVLTNQRETFTLQDEQNRNQYTVDVIYDDETNRILCNETLDYINNTKTTLDKIYLHIYPNAFCEEKLVPFEENEMDWAKNNPNSFDNFVNNLKEMFVTSSNNKKEIHINDKNNEKEIQLSKNNTILPTIAKGMETINNISNNLYNYYVNQNGEEVPDLPYK